MLISLSSPKDLGVTTYADYIMVVIACSILELDKYNAMNETSIQFLQQLRAAVEGVLFVSAGDYPFEIFTWDLEADGEFNTHNFLQRQKYLESVPLSDPFGLAEYSTGYQRSGVRTPDGGLFYASSDLMDDFLEASRKQGASEPFSHMNEKQDAAAQYAQNLLAFINGLTAQGYEVFAYRVVRRDIFSSHGNEYFTVDHRSATGTYESSRLLTIKATSGGWGAISTYEKRYADVVYKTPESFVSNGLNNSASIEKDFGKVKEASKGLVFIRRNCYDDYEEANELIFELADSQAAVIDRALHGNGFIRTCRFDSLSLDGEGLSIDGPEGLANEDYSHGKFVPIDWLLKSYLNNMRTIFVGTHSVFDVYFVGQDSDGNWLGLNTVAVWT